MKDILYILYQKNLYIFSCGGLFLCWSVFGPLGGSQRRNIVDIRTVLWYQPFFSFFSFFPRNGAHMTRRSVGPELGLHHSALTANPEVGEGKRNEKKKETLKNRPRPVAPASGTKRGAAIRDSRDGCKFSRRARKKTSFLFISFFFFFLFFRNVYTLVCTISPSLFVLPC